MPRNRLLIQPKIYLLSLARGTIYGSSSFQVIPRSTHLYLSLFYLLFFLLSRLTDTIVALKEIRLEHEEGAPCTAIRESKLHTSPVLFGCCLMSTLNQ